MCLHLVFGCMDKRVRFCSFKDCFPDVRHCRIGEVLTFLWMRRYVTTKNWNLWSYNCMALVAVVMFRYCFTLRYQLPNGLCPLPPISNTCTQLKRLAKKFLLAIFKHRTAYKKQVKSVVAEHQLLAKLKCSRWTQCGRAKQCLLNQNVHMLKNSYHCSSICVAALFKNNKIYPTKPLANYLI